MKQKYVLHKAYLKALCAIWKPRAKDSDVITLWQIIYEIMQRGKNFVKETTNSRISDRSWAEEISGADQATLFISVRQIDINTCK